MSPMQAKALRLTFSNTCTHLVGDRVRDSSVRKLPGHSRGQEPGGTWYLGYGAVLRLVGVKQTASPLVLSLFFVFHRFTFNAAPGSTRVGKSGPTAGRAARSSSSFACR